VPLIDGQNKEAALSTGSSYCFCKTFDHHLRNRIQAVFLAAGICAVYSQNLYWIFLCPSNQLNMASHEDDLMPTDESGYKISQPKQSLAEYQKMGKSMLTQLCRESCRIVTAGQHWTLAEQVRVFGRLQTTSSQATPPPPPVPIGQVRIDAMVCGVELPPRPYEACSNSLSTYVLGIGLQEDGSRCCVTYSRSSCNIVQLVCGHIVRVWNNFKPRPCSSVPALRLLYAV
jgi:hypothetical protein